MKLFYWNIILALTWSLAGGDLSPSRLAIGFLLGYLVLWIARPAFDESAYFRRIPKTIGFILFFIRQLILANLQVAYEVLTPRYRMRPGIVAVPLDAKTDLEITLLANLITLTPGTLSLDVSEDRNTLYVHAMFMEDAEAFRNNIKNGFERRLLEVMR
ncbi:MAG: Na+/H+ antiporter subunit E [Acidobacteriota bacterium]